MELPLELWVALRYLRGRRRERFISLITWISVGGVAVGVTALIVVLSVMTGFERDLRDKILGTNAHVVVYPMGGTLTDYRRVTRKVRAVEGVVAATPFVSGQVMLVYGGNVTAALLRGVDPETAGDATDLSRFLVEGSLSDLTRDGPGVILGRELARNLGILVGDTVQLVSPAGGLTPLGLVPRIRAFRVKGLFASGMYEYDTGIVVTSLAEAQDFLRLGDGVSGIEVRVADLYDARRAARRIESVLGAGYWARDWMEMNRNLFSALKLEKTAMFIILALIVVVAAFNIAATLIMVVLEKSREIGVLKSMGATARTIRRIFVAEGMVIGGLGTAMGLIGGWGLCSLLERYRFIRLPSDVYYIDTLPVVMEPEVFLIVAGCALALCFLATLYPSWQAARMDPVEILRYE
ncbi:lipoprotein-releasing ABC transporter permease subunit [Deferrisoma camini]|uniref:lipoprotein-releasing ABC transporter permease subunit n=1 Tax=Deferrisoma camini TaxID=1035120 RepID=UPI00046D18A3|nr:lipoprotein-releasing ABC transporter permease subunit [Deferrisoma camini]